MRQIGYQTKISLSSKEDFSEQAVKLILLFYSQEKSVTIANLVREILTQLFYTML